jgi:TolB-like protein
MALIFWTQQAAEVRRAPAGRRIMLAVLPFQDLSGDATQEFFSDRLTEEMIGTLGRLQPARLGVIARTSGMQYKHDRKGVDQIGRDLGVATCWKGRSASRVTACASAPSSCASPTRARSGARSWSAT